MNNIKKVVLIQGGDNAESSISRITGQTVAQALTELRINFTPLESNLKLYENLIKIQPDVAFLAVHGAYGEDGTLQGLLEYLKIPYTGSGVLSSALCMNKKNFKQMLAKNQILTPPFLFLNIQKNSTQFLDFYGLQKELTEKLEVDIRKNKTLSSPPFLPCVVKPNRSGSSIGVTICFSEKEWGKAMEDALKIDHEILIEEYVEGIEIAVSYLRGRALTPVEIQPEKGFFYDFKRKYEKNKTQYALPPTLPSHVVQKIQEITVQVQQLCQVKTYGRLDFIVDGNRNAYALDMNTLPGLTPLSLLPMSAKHDDISYNQLIQLILEKSSLEYELNLHNL